VDHGKLFPNLVKEGLPTRGVVFLRNDQELKSPWHRFEAGRAEEVYDYGTVRRWKAGFRIGSGMNSHEKPLGIPGGLLARLFLVLMAVLPGGAALRESVTIDEVAHIGADRLRQ
jgi:hypothetical protein